MNLSPALPTKFSSQKGSRRAAGAFVLFLYNRVYGLCQDAAQDAAGGGFRQALDPYQQHHKHKGICRAQLCYQALNKIAPVEHQHNVAHKEQGVQQRRADGAHKIAPGALVIRLGAELIYIAAAKAHEHPHSHAQNHRVQGADGEEGARHHRPAGNGVGKAEDAEDGTHDHALQWAAENGAHGNGQGQKAHVEGSYRHGSQADCPHDQLNGNEQCQLGQTSDMVGCGFHMQFLLLPFYIMRTE